MTLREIIDRDNTMTLREIVDEVFAKHNAECLRLTEQLNKTISERDAARREVCEFEEYCIEEANKRGWDCYKNKETQ